MNIALSKTISMPRLQSYISETGEDLNEALTLYERNKRLPESSDVHGRLNALRRFRNRIAHHEPIFKRDLVKTHSEIIETMGWMCADTRIWAAHRGSAIEVISSLRPRG